MSDRHWAFEDFAEGSSIELGTKIVTAEEIIEFASQFDPQPMHLDETAGKASLLGGLAASGWHTCAIYMRMLVDSVLLNSTSQGAPGIDYVKWKRPVIAGDRLSARCVVQACRLSKSRPGIGLVTVRHEMVNQDNDLVLEMENTVMMRTRARHDA
jgi:acyl dehydratase